MTHLPNELLTDRQAATVLGVSVSLLRCWRLRLDGGPSFYRVGRLVRYSHQGLSDFLAAGKVDPQTSSQRTTSRTDEPVPWIRMPGSSSDEDENLGRREMKNDGPVSLSNTSPRLS